MDTSGFLIYPFCCLGFIISGIIAQTIVFLLTKMEAFAELPEEDKAALKVVTFLIGLTAGLAASYFIISYIFRDLYVM